MSNRGNTGANTAKLELIMRGVFEGIYDLTLQSSYDMGPCEFEILAIHPDLVRSRPASKQTLQRVSSVNSTQTKSARRIRANTLFTVVS